MPQIQILPEAPGFGSQLGEALGGGIGKGIEGGIATRLESLLNSKKELANVRSNVNLLAKRYGKDAFDPDKLFALEKTASDLIRQNLGLSAQDATTLAFLQNQQEAEAQEAQKPKEKSNSYFDLWGYGDEHKFINDPSKLGSDVVASAEKFAYPFVQNLDIIQQAFDPNKAAELDLLRQGYTPEEIAQSKKQIQSHLPSFLQQDVTPESLTEKYLTATGGVGPGENKIERAVQGALGTFHPAGAAGTLASEGAEELGAPPVVQSAADALAFVLAIKSGPKVGAAFKANERVLSNAERVAEQTGLKAEEVIARAQQESGADLAKAAQGDAKEINKLNGRISAQAPKGAEKVSATEKTVFSPKEAIKQREKVSAERLAKSPYTAYYEIEARKEAKEAGKTEPTLAKEAETTERLQPLEKQKTQELDVQRQQLKDLERDVKNLTGSDKSRVEATIEFKKKQIQKTLDELADIRHELKHFEKRPTDAQIEADAKKRAEEFVEEARNPTEEGQKKLARDIELDKKFIERAEELLKHPEIPGDIHPDTFLRVKEKYLDAYQGKVAELREANRSLKGARDVQSLKTIGENKKAIQALEDRIKRLKADIVNQRDKIKALSNVKGAKGAFYKQQLKKLRRDVEQFQRDFFRDKQGKPETVQEVITEKVAKKGIAEAPKINLSEEGALNAGEKVGKNPTKENIKEVAEKVGENPKDVQEGVDQLKDKMKSNKEKIENGTANEKDVKNLETVLDKYINKYSNIFKKKAPQVSKTIGRSFGVGIAKGLLEEMFDVKIQSEYLSLGASVFGNRYRMPGRAIGLTLGGSLVHWIFDKHEASKLKELRKNPNEYAKHVQNLKKRYAPKRVSGIIEDSK